MNSAEVAELLGNPSCQIDCKTVSAADEFSLRVYVFTPDGGGTGRPVVFIPGWTSVMDGWAPLLSSWVEKRVIYYIETREKCSCQAPKRRLKKSDYEMRKHTEDLEAVCKALDIPNDALWFGSSLGGTVILHGMMEGKLSGSGAFLISPNTKFRFSGWMVPLISMPWWFYPPLIRLCLPYLKFRLKERAQYIRYRRTLLNANVLRLKRSVQANRRYDLPSELDKINIPVAVCVAASDTLHTGDDSHGIADRLPQGQLLEVPSNQYAHEADIIADIDAWELASQS